MRFTLIVLSLALTLFPIGPLSAQDQPGGVVPQQQLLDAGQLDQLVAPIALHPDPLLAQVLMASTYPLEIVQTRTLIIRGNGKRPVVGILTKHRQRLPVATGERVAEVLQL